MKLTLFSVLAAWLLALAGCQAVAPVSSPVVAVDVIEQSIVLDNGNYKVPAIYTKPAVQGKRFAAVIMLHGTASQKNEVGGLYQRLAAQLAQEGIASLRIDFAGTGDSPVDYRHYSLTSAVGDALTGVNFLAAQADINSERLGVIGFSQGGLIAQRAALADSRLQALVAWSSVAEDGIGPFKFLFDQYYAEAQAKGFATVHFDWRPTPLYFGLQWFDEVKSHTTLTDFSAYRGKLLAIAGTADPIVPYASAINLVARSSSKNAEALLIKNADHMFNVLGDGGANGLAQDQSTAELLLSSTRQWLLLNL